MGYDWPWFILLLLRVLFLGVPFFFIAVLQNFYVQSVIFATERAAAINRGEEEEASGGDEQVEAEELWKGRLVCLAATISNVCRKVYPDGTA